MALAMTNYNEFSVKNKKSLHFGLTVRNWLPRPARCACTQADMQGFIHAYTCLCCVGNHYCLRQCDAHLVLSLEVQHAVAACCKDLGLARSHLPPAHWCATPLTSRLILLVHCSSKDAAAMAAAAAAAAHRPASVCRADAALGA